MFSAKVTSLYHPVDNGAGSIIGYSRNLEQSVIVFKVKENQRFRFRRDEITLLNLHIHEYLTS